MGDTDIRFVVCEHCQGEGHIYVGHSNDPNPRDDGPCPVCLGECMVEVAVEPLTEDETYDSAMAREHGPDFNRER